VFGSKMLIVLQVQSLFFWQKNLQTQRHQETKKDTKEDKNN
jgi:hypothetical protein